MSSMTAYLDSLHAKFSAAEGEIADILERCVTENRDPSDDERKQIERAEQDRATLEKSIEDQTARLERSNKVNTLRGRFSGHEVRPVVERSVEKYNILDDIPTPGHYAYHLHRAVVKGDRDSQEILQRVAAEQTTADNAGIIPNPIVGSVVDIVKGRRRFLDSIQVRQAPTNKFSRPVVTQHVTVGAQAAELDELSSQKMTIDDVDVALNTFGGYLNLSKQDVRWSSPGILNILFESFAKQYAKASDNFAADEFVTLCTVTEALDLSDFTADPRGKMDAWLTGALGDLDEDAMPDTLWMSPNIAGILRFERSEGGQRTYNIPLGNEVGDAEGLRVVVAPNFATSTLILGDSEYVEAYEDLEGFLTVDIPSALGQQIGYAGYIDLIVTDATAFSKAAVVA